MLGIFYLATNKFMKLTQLLREEVVPLSSRQSLILYIIIACVFQFVLFYAPALADNAIKEAQASEQTDRMTSENGSANLEFIGEDDLIIANELIIKTDRMDESAANIKNSTAPIVYGPKTQEEQAKLVYYGPERQKQALPEAKSEPKIIRVSTHVMTAYNSDPRQTDDTPCITANGFNVCEHGIEDTIAANFLKFGTKVMIPDLFGDRIFIVRDRMNKRYPDRVDIWMLDYGDARKFGVKTAKIHVIE